MTKKLKLHSTIDERQKKHRNAFRSIKWGQGVTEGVDFSWSMLRPAFWGTWLSISILYIIVTILPYKATLALGRSLGRLMRRFLKSRRYVVKRNVELAFPEMSSTEREKLEVRIFENTGMGIFETGIAWFWPDWRLKRLAIFDPADIARAKALAESQTRTIVFTIHSVTLELGARIYALTIAPGIGVYRSSDHPVWEYIQVKGRLRSNYALVDRKDVRSLVKVILKGIPIWYQPDQDFGMNSAVFVPFFGVKEAATVTGLHHLARVKGVKVLPYWLTRVDGGYKMNLMETLENFPTEDPVADTARANQIIEHMIRDDLSQYMWVHRRFKTCPPGTPSRYPDIE